MKQSPVQDTVQVHLISQSLPLLDGNTTETRQHCLLKQLRGKNSSLSNSNTVCFTEWRKNFNNKPYVS